MIISTEAEKAFYKIQHSFMTKKNLSAKLGIERHLLTQFTGKSPWLTQYLLGEQHTLCPDGRDKTKPSTLLPSGEPCTGVPSEGIKARKK